MARRQRDAATIVDSSRQYTMSVGGKQRLSPNRHFQPKSRWIFWRHRERGRSASAQRILGNGKAFETNEDHIELPVNGRAASTERESSMSERIETLKKARERMADDRDTFAKTLAAPFDRDKAERARLKFIETQVLIDAIDRAIAGEQARPVPAA
jgi:hypothetical protein